MGRIPSGPRASSTCSHANTCRRRSPWWAAGPGRFRRWCGGSWPRGTGCAHTLTHPQPFPRLPAEEIEHQVAAAQAAIADAADVSSHLFRSPGGGWSPVVFDTAARHGLVPIDWGVDPRDWARPGTAAISRRLLRAKPGVLCHDGGGNRAQTYAALIRVLPELKSRGFTFVTL